MHGSSSHHEHKHKHKHKHNDSSQSPTHASANKLASSEKHSNVRSAFIHVLGGLFFFLCGVICLQLECFMCFDCVFELYKICILDLLQSVGLLIAATLIWFDHDTFQLADAICTLIFSVIVMFTTVSLVKDAFKILMESVPESVDFEKIKKSLNSLSNVQNVHDLHVWNLSVGKIALSAHLVLSIATMEKNGNNIPTYLDIDAILQNAQTICRDNFGINHCTIQIECPKSSQIPSPSSKRIDAINNDENETSSKHGVNINM